MRTGLTAIVCAAVLALSGLPPAEVRAQEETAEVTFWKSVADSPDPREIEAYLKAFPDGVFAPLARLRIRKLQEIEAKRGGGELGDRGLSRVEPEKPPQPPRQDKPLPAEAVSAPPAEAPGTAASAPDDDSVAGRLQGAARAGDIAAMTDLAWRYGRGSEVERSAVAAARWLRAAAEAGDAASMTALGRAYETGAGLVRSDAQAVAWYRRAAAAGDGDGMADLARMLEGGRGATADEAEAVRLYNEAALKDNALAMHRLALKYDRGEGVGADPGTSAAMTYAALVAGHGLTRDLVTGEANTLFGEAQRKALQRELRAAGAYNGRIDGDVGPGTLRAVAKVAGATAADAETPRELLAGAIDIVRSAYVTEPDVRELIGDAMAGIANAYPDRRLEAAIAARLRDLDVLPLVRPGDDDIKELALGRFDEAFATWRADHTPRIDADDLANAALTGMLEGLDPHCGYYSPDAVADLNAQSSGEFGGVGIEVTMSNGLVEVVTPIDGTPGHRAGLAPGDRISAIDGRPVFDLDLGGAVALMRGKIGTPVTLTVAHGDNAPREVEIMRDTIRVDTVRTEREGDVGYIRITRFNEQTPGQIKAALEAFRRHVDGAPERYVIDLRNNPGGVLTPVLEVAGFFLDGGTIMTSKGRRDEDNWTREAEAGDLLAGARLVVLINGGSAAGSEIMAGALRDAGRVTLVGSRTFGKGTAQSLFPLANGGYAKVTTTIYFTPNGREIQARGIEPDIVVEQYPPGETGRATFGEARLDAHLRPERSGRLAGSNWIPADAADDRQLQAAFAAARRD